MDKYEASFDPLIHPLKLLGKIYLIRWLTRLIVIAVILLEAVYIVKVYQFEFFTLFVVTKNGESAQIKTKNN